MECDAASNPRKEAQQFLRQQTKAFLCAFTKKMADELRTWGNEQNTPTNAAMWYHVSHGLEVTEPGMVAFASTFATVTALADGWETDIIKTALLRRKAAEHLLSVAEEEAKGSDGAGIAAEESKETKDSTKVSAEVLKHAAALQHFCQQVVYHLCAWSDQPDGHSLCAIIAGAGVEQPSLDEVRAFLSRQTAELRRRCVRREMMKVLYTWVHKQDNVRICKQWSLVNLELSSSDPDVVAFTEAFNAVVALVYDRDWDASRDWPLLHLASISGRATSLYCTLLWLHPALADTRDSTFFTHDRKPAIATLVEWLWRYRWGCAPPYMQPSVAWLVEVLKFPVFTQFVFSTDTRVIFKVRRHPYASSLPGWFSTKKPHAITERPMMTKAGAWRHLAKPTTRETNFTVQASGGSVLRK